MVPVPARGGREAAPPARQKGEDAGQSGACAVRLPRISLSPDPGGKRNRGVRDRPGISLHGSRIKRLDEAAFAVYIRAGAETEPYRASSFKTLWQPLPPRGAALAFPSGEHLQGRVGSRPAGALRAPPLTFPSPSRLRPRRATPRTGRDAVAGDAAEDAERAAREAPSRARLPGGGGAGSGAREAGLPGKGRRQRQRRPPDPRRAAFPRRGGGTLPLRREAPARARSAPRRLLEGGARPAALLPRGAGGQPGAPSARAGPPSSPPRPAPPAPSRQVPPRAGFAAGHAEPARWVAVLACSRRARAGSRNTIKTN